MARIPWVAPKALPVPIEDAASPSRAAHAGGGAGAETAHDEPSARSGADWTDPRGVRIAGVIDEFLQGFAAITTGYRLLFPQKPLFFDRAAPPAKVGAWVTILRSTRFWNP